MDHFCKDTNEETITLQQGITRCPFLRNINEPTNFTFLTSMPLTTPAVRGVGEKGPIFEDDSNFDMAFRFFHGKNGLVPLSGRSFNANEKPGSERMTPHFNPFAAKAATISMSDFGLGGPFGFDAFSDKWKKSNKSESSKKKSSSEGGGTHEAMSNEWLQTGNCPITKSYRAISHVLPLVAKFLQPPSGMKNRCPPAIVAARAALSKTAFAKNLRPQLLPAKILVIGVLGMAANIPLGVWREHTKQFSFSWFVAVHAAVPFIAMLRKSVLMPKTAIAITIAASFLGQVIGSRAECYRLKAAALENRNLSEPSVTRSNPGILVVPKNSRCAEIDDWSRSIAGQSSLTDVFS